MRRDILGFRIGWKSPLTIKKIGPRCVRCHRDTRRVAEADDRLCYECWSYVTRCPKCGGLGLSWKPETTYMHDHSICGLTVVKCAVPA